MDYKKAYQDLLLADRVSMRERLVLDVMKHRPQYTAGMATAAALTLMNFIEGDARVEDQFVVGTNKAAGRRGSKRGVKRGPYKKAKKPIPAIGAVTQKIWAAPWELAKGKTIGELPSGTAKSRSRFGKRKYTKKAAYWNDPAKAKKAKAARRKKK